MIIKSILLENIRSYKKENIEFEEGINFLSGDIGSGKSSILQAIEFAFFGFKRGDLEGVHLLRKGEKEGSVSLILKNNNSEIEIFRKIKRSNSGNISQENGYIKDKDNLLELSPLELNSKIFEILNFPKEFLTKDKNLIYRFTIYTPQEQLKEILFSETEKRLEIIRKIFSIDKYKQLKDAISIYNSKIREDKKYLEGKMEINSDFEKEIKTINEDIKNLELKLDEKKKEEKPLNEKLIFYDESLNKNENLLEKIQDKIILIEKNLSKIEELENGNKKLNEEFDSKKTLIENLEKRDLFKESNEIENKILSKEKEIKNLKTEFEELEKKEMIISKIDKEIAELEFKIKQLAKEIQNGEKEIEDALHLENCPTCFQKVSDEHKEKLKEEVKKKNSKKVEEKNQFEIKIEELNSQIKTILGNLENIKEGQNKINLKEREINNIISNQKIEKEKLSLQITQKKNLQEEIKNISKRIENNNVTISKKEEFEKKNILLKQKRQTLRENITKIKNISNKIKEKEKEISNEISTINANLTSNQKNLLKIEKEINVFKENKIKFEKLIKTEDFLNKKLVNISQNIETYVFTKYYEEFNEEFEKFFKELIEDNEIDVRLGFDFTPIVEQNGYDIDISNLSGGEKSSLAISYRFGLKKIIEDNIEETQKLSLLILDEPTDGFSFEQVDRLGEILKNLNLQQIILVSHDNRIDTISDKIINIEKENHISFILN